MSPRLKQFLLVATTVTLTSAFYVLTAPPEPPPSAPPPATPTLQPVSPSPGPTIPPSPTSVELINFDIPQTWRKYAKRFQKLDFEFYYPPQYSISDGDEDSGDIYLMTRDGQYAMAIGRLSYYGLPEYQSGSRRVWFTNVIKAPYGITDTGSLRFVEVNFQNGNSYYQVIGNPDQVPILETKSNSLFFYGIFSGHAILVRDHGKLSQSDRLRVMQTLKVN